MQVLQYLKVQASCADNAIVSPIFFRLSNANDRQQLENILKDKAAIQLHDCLYQQLVELIKIRNLSKANELQNIEDKIKVHLNNIPIEEYGVWVYYPWLNKIVHILDEEEFVEVRTNRNQHKITKNELAVLRKKKIGVIGLSVGQSIASTLMLERCCGEIRIADFDTLELSNLNRIKTGLYNLGLNKVVQAAREIAEIDPFIKIVCYEDGVTEDNLDDFLTKNGKLDLLIEECDSLDIKILSRIKAKQFNIPVLMETNDKGMIDIERFDLDSDYPLLHNLIGDITGTQLKNLTTEQKIPVLMKMVGFETVSLRQKLTVLEIGQTISTWPQLASNVIMGAGIVTDVARRMLLGYLNVSGRFYIDIECLIKDNTPPAPLYTPPVLKELPISEIVTLADSIPANEGNHVMTPSEDLIKMIVSDAGMAPSSGNDQPWKFLFRNGKLFLFHEMSRSYSFGDYKNMASYISLGSAIENVVLSAHKQGQEIAVHLFPLENNTTCIAEFDFKSKTDNTTEKHDYDELYNYIHERCTNRKITPNEIAPLEVLQELTQAAESIKNANSCFVTDKAAFQEIGSIISAGDRIRIMEPQGHYDFFHREIRASSAEVEAKRTGMDISTLELSQQATLALQVVKSDEAIKVLRDIDGLQALKTVSVPNAINSSAIGLITMPNFNPVEFVNGGRAMQRQWLKSTQLGYAYHPMVVPLYLFYRTIFGNGEALSLNTFNEINDLRRRFLQIFPGDDKRGEILLFRIFKAENILKRSPRLPLNEILFI